MKRSLTILSFSIAMFCLLLQFPIVVWADTWLWPVPSSHTLSRGYGYDENGVLHEGIDIIGALDAPIVAAKSGTVCRVVHGDIPNVYIGGGNAVVIDHGNGLYSHYAHLNSTAVSEGQYVNAGTVIGYMGRTGNATGVHLHFAIASNSYGGGGRINNNTDQIGYVDGGGNEGSEMTSGYSRQLADGDYIIACAGDINYQLDIAGDVVPATTYANINVWPRSNPEREQDVFTVRYDNGFYSIKQKNTNMSLDIWDGRKTVGENIQMFPNNDSSAQRWALSRAVINGIGEAGYRIQAKRSGWTVVPEGSVISQGRNVIQSYYTNGVGDGWSFIPYMPEQPIAEGKYILVSSEYIFY